MSYASDPTYRSHSDNTGYTDYDPAIATMADDGHGAAPRSSPIMASCAPEYDRAIAVMDDDGFGAAPRG
ncbi:MAG: hypothetical protein EON60_09955 [Alphaproteobacteria bacterium]|nr:MAG: hypothetical protein EON60_09955 [Alphaproteobacteria bacterium]